MSVKVERRNLIAIVGGGCSGVLVASHLLRTGKRVHIVVIDASGELGHGPAYGTECLLHQLNTRAGDMSGLVDSPEDFLEWSSAVGTPVSSDAFVPRALYGQYLSNLVDRALESSHPESTFELVTSEVLAIAPHRDGAQAPLLVGLKNGGHIEATAVVLAIGTGSPRPQWIEDIEGQSVRRRIIADPWTPRALGNIPAESEVLLVGTGLTMVDVAIELSSQARCRRLVARSRHGLLPLVHRAGYGGLPTGLGDRRPLDDFPALLGEVPELSARKVVRAVRQAVEKGLNAGSDWRDVITEFRMRAPELWSALPSVEQRRILRHALRYWEIHRHRITPEADGRIRELVASGTLEIARGRVLEVRPREDQVEVDLRTSEGRERLVVDYVVNCTGPGNDVANDSMLIRSLVDIGFASASRNGVGLEVDEDGDLINSQSVTIHTVGWVRRGRHLETTGVPEIRTQAAAIADRIVTTLGLQAPEHV